MNKKLSLSAGLLGLLCFVSPTQAETDFSGYLEGELRYYPQDALYEVQDDVFGSAALELDTYWLSENEDHTIQFKPFGRITTAEDGNRDHVDIRELYYRYAGNRWQITAGINKVFWGVAESAHLVDIVNQTDAVESFSGEEKLGQPMVALGIEQNWGNLDMYVLPYFRERKFAQGSERNQFAVPLPGGDPEEPIAINEGESLYESSREQEHVDFAARWSNYYGSLDIALSYFNGTSREPITFAAINPNATTQAELLDELHNYYQQMQQFGLELQYLYEGWAFKFEGSHKTMDTGDYSELVTGFEYTFSDMGPWGQDVGVLVEYLWNNRGEIDTLPLTLEDGGAPVQALYQASSPAQQQQLAESAKISGQFFSPFANDVFVGARFTLNDIDSTQFLAGFIVDADTQETLASFEGSRRFGNSITASLNIYLITHAQRDSSLYLARQDDLIEAKVRWYF